MSEDRLDRLEALAEKILEGLAETRHRTDSNAKSIQALSDAVARDREAFNIERKEWAQDRRRVFEWMARLAAAQADFYEMQADHLNHLERIDALRSSPRRERLTDILDRLTPKPD
ncbi:hypothetical protein C7H19_18980 [Aphanothece hegewaldii CCALA 016]|uniref:Uncharacterized protein n=1 Tax=Aphanothece hegewaldii CCALA 016 TaxID=2107694 RepID=A0A2T1LTU0_9CHRO|nr:hypothetical protein [Aphanothece hegewaldii]PSF34520.1 hypothetical protein C7H19_18980 [Aphanothece hegewaldii CCALA 016]